MKSFTRPRLAVFCFALITLASIPGFSETNPATTAPWAERAQTAISNSFMDGKSLSIFGSNLIGIIHPTGTAGFLDDLNFKTNPDGSLVTEFALSWKGGLVGTDYKTVVLWAVSETGHISSRVVSDTAPTAVSKEALTKMDKYFSETLIDILGDARPQKLKKATPNRKVQAALSALSSIRLALQGFYGDNEGAFPKDLRDLTPKYLAEIPIISVKPGVTTNAVVNPKLAAINSCRSVLGTGGWLYFNNSKSTPTWGNVVIDSKDLSPEGKRWCEY